MDDSLKPIHVPGTDLDVSLGDCALHSHDFCDAKVCQVRRVAGVLHAVTEGQIKIAVATGIAGIAVSTVFALALVGVWYQQAMAGHPMPDVPWFILSVAMVPFGSALMMKVPKNE